MSDNIEDNIDISDPGVYDASGLSLGPDPKIDSALLDFEKANADFELAATGTAILIIFVILLCCGCVGGVVWFSMKMK